MIKSFVFGVLFCLLSGCSVAEEKQHVVYDGFDGPGKGKHVVLISGDEEYRSEESMPQLGKILAKHHGFKCTVLFSIDKKTGDINPLVSDNIPGLEALQTADLVIINLRFRKLPDDQMKYIDEYVNSGKPMMGMRTATHAFNGIKGKYAKYNFRAKAWSGGFGRQVLGETWINHHGHHNKESTRGVIEASAKESSIVKGCEDIWGKTDVYGIRKITGDNVNVLVRGQVLKGMKPEGTAVDGKKNSPMMPVAWTKTFTGSAGKAARVFTTTMGSSQDVESEGLRRLIVNGAYWCLGLEAKIVSKANVDIVGVYKATHYKHGKHVQGRKPSFHEMKK